MNKTAKIDYRDGVWLVGFRGFGDEMGFFSHASAISFVANNLRATAKLTTAALSRVVDEAMQAERLR